MSRCSDAEDKEDECCGRIVEQCGVEQCGADLNLALETSQDPFLQVLVLVLGP